MSVAELSAMSVRDAASAQAMFAYAHQLGVVRDVVFRAPPPEPTTCCGRGCHGCVWEGFLIAAHYWRVDAVALLNGSP